MSRPIIIATYSNSSANRLAYLQEEITDLTHQFQPGQFSESLIFSTSPFDTKSSDLPPSINNLIQSGKKLTVFHYSGHADEQHFLLEEGAYEKNQLLNLLSGVSIDVVVLNGCNTEGFVNALLDSKNVKIVIATSNKIGDLKASEFSKLFYEAWLAGAGVEHAFNRAIQSVKAENSYTVQHGMLPRINARQLCPWGIYYLKENAQIAETLTLRSADESNAPIPDNPTFTEEFNNLQKELLKLEKYIPKYTLTKDEDFLDLIRESADRLNLRLNPEDLMTLLQNAHLKVNELYSTQHAPIRQESIRNNLMYFNYLGQKSAWKPIGLNYLPNTGTLTLGAFVLQGGSSCGLGWLQEIFLKQYKVSADRASIRTISIITTTSFIKTAIRDESAVWQELNMMGKLGLTDVKPETVVKAIYELHKKMHVVISFEKSIDKTGNLLLISKFWKEFRRLFTIQQATDMVTVPYKTFLFIQDIGCKRIPSGNGFVSDRQTDYITQTKDEPFTYVLPIVDTVSPDKVDEWSALYEAYPLDLSQFKEGEFVIPTILKICREFGTCDPDYKQTQSYFFSRYAAKL